MMIELNTTNLPIVGAICGDILGSGYEHFRVKDLDMKLCCRDDIFTDDTVCTIAVADSLLNQKDIGKTLKRWCRKYDRVGYGARFRAWFEGYYDVSLDSWGNGSAMRVSAAGAISSSIEDATELAYKSAIPTHNHPEGIKGAQSTAVAIYLAKCGTSKQDIKDYISVNFGYDLNRRYEDIQPTYRFDVSCQGSVPESIICFLESSDYEDAIRHAIAMGGDADTMAAIAGSIAAAYYKEIPHGILQHCISRLPKDMISIINSISNL